MTRKHVADPFSSLSDADLASVNGGRLIASKQTDPAVVQGIEMLAKTIVEVGQLMQANTQAKSQQSTQLMQQLMERRQGGGGR